MIPGPRSYLTPNRDQRLEKYYSEPLGRKKQMVLAAYADDVVVVAEVENSFKRTDTNLIVAANGLV